MKFVDYLNPYCITTCIVYGTTFGAMLSFT